MRSERPGTMGALAAAAALLALAAGCERGRVEPNGQRVAIGLVVSAQGPGRLAEEPGLEAVEWYFQRQPLTRDGTRVEVVTADDRSSADGLASALATLARRPDLVAVVTFAPGDRLLEAAPRIDALGVPIVAAAATNPAVAESTRFVSLLSFDDPFQATVAALYARNELGLRRAAVFSVPGSPRSQLLAGKFASRFEGSGGRVVAQGAMSATADPAALVELARQAESDVAYLALEPADALALAGAVAGSGWNPVLMVPDGVLAGALEADPGRAGLLEGALGTDLYAPGMYIAPAGRKLLGEYGRRGRRVTTHGVLGLEAADLLGFAVEHCGTDPDRACVQGVLRTPGHLAGALGSVAFRETGLAERPVVVNTLRDGRREFVARVY